MKFRRTEFPKVGGRRPEHEKSGSERGYGAKWERFSQNYRRKHPFCRFCEQDGFECVPAECVDHIIPISDGGARFDPENCQSLCNKHHYGTKERMQVYARKMGMVDQLPRWCADPNLRPDFTKRV